MQIVVQDRWSLEGEPSGTSPEVLGVTPSADNNCVEIAPCYGALLLYASSTMVEDARPESPNNHGVPITASQQDVKSQGSSRKQPNTTC